MLYSFRSLVVRHKYLLRDLIGILLALAVGIAGQLLLADPLNLGAAELPVLSAEDWPGSQASANLKIVEGWSWRERRGFQQSLAQMEDVTPVVQVSQTLVWYADPMQPAAEWKSHFAESYNGHLLVAKSLDEDKPLSMLFCSDDSEYPRECSYLAYWRHWYTEVTIWSRTEADLPVTERKELTDRVDQLLMSAPDQPCGGIFCTEKSETGR